MNIGDYLKQQTLNSNTPYGVIARAKEDMEQRERMNQDNKLITSMRALIDSKKKNK